MSGDITTKITGYDREELDQARNVEVKVISHWNQNRFFGLVIDGKTIWFDRTKFEKAIQNACNHGY